MKHCPRLCFILLCIAIMGLVIPVSSIPDEIQEVDIITSSLSESDNKTTTKDSNDNEQHSPTLLKESQNKTVTKVPKQTKKPKKTPKKSKKPTQTTESKQIVSSALKSFKPLNIFQPNNITRFVRQNKVQLTILVAVALFRQEIVSLTWHFLSRPVTNVKTGVTQRVLSVYPTRILQVLFVAEMLRRLHQSCNNGENTNVSPIAAALVMGRLSNPALALFLSKLFSPGSSIYLPPTRQHFTFETINDRYSKDLLAFHKAVRANGSRGHASSNISAVFPSMVKQALLGSQPSFNETVVVMDWTNLDSSVSRMDIMRDEVSFLIKNYESQSDVADTSLPRFEEVVVLLESQGGSAADYSLASQQILRLRKTGVKVTICVDKIAASGGYMIACTSSPGCLLAAPFAVLGSIGVLGQTINIQKTLEGWGIRPLVFKGGKDKAPVGLIGDVTRDGLAKVQQMIDKTHVAFKDHVGTCRPLIASEIDSIATGDIWLGYDALSRGLVDRITTSDEYIGEKVSGGAIILKLVQLIRGRYPFQPPTTTSGIRYNNDLSGHKSVQSAHDLGEIFDSFRKVFSYFQQGEDNKFAWTRFMGTELQMKESLIRHS